MQHFRRKMVQTDQEFLITDAIPDSTSEHHHPTFFKGTYKNLLPFRYDDSDLIGD